jgi:chemotaxis protein MotB
LGPEGNTFGKKKSDGDDDIFMVSFSSLMILLLTFMILMVTLARFKEPRFRKAIGSVKGAFSFLPHSGSKNPVQEGSAGFLPDEMLARAAAEESEEDEAYRRVVQEIKSKAQQSELSGLEIDEIEGGLAIRISDALMFEKGEASLKLQILPLLDIVAEAVNLRPGRVSVVGNTCDLPIRTHEFPSNWELSIVRAVNVMHHLETRAVQPESLFAYGMADQCPIAANDTEEHRKQNRRVEIYVTYRLANRKEANSGEIDAIESPGG